MIIKHLLRNNFCILHLLYSNIYSSNISIKYFYSLIMLKARNLQQEWPKAKNNYMRNCVPIDKVCNVTTIFV